MPWDLTGNTGIKPTTNFVGTRDNQPLTIRTNNTEKVRVTPTGDVGIGTATPSAKLHLMGGGLRWANPGSSGSVLSTDQGGSIELGADNSAPGMGTPYIDFHFRGLTQDFNARIINDSDGKLSVIAN